MQFILKTTTNFKHYSSHCAMFPTNRLLHSTPTCMLKIVAIFKNYSFEPIGLGRCPFDEK